MNWIISAILSAVFAALVAIFGKIGLSKVDATLATTIRATIMAGFFLIASFSLGKYSQIGTIENKVLLFIVLSGLAGALSWLFYFFALKTGPVAGVAALDRLSIVFALVLAAIFLGEAITWRTGIGAILITLGALFMVWK